MITINYDFTSGTEVSYFEGLELKDNFTTNCLDFFNFDENVDDVIVIDKFGNKLSRNELLLDNSFTNKKITTSHNIHKMLKSGSFDWRNKNTIDFRKEKIDIKYTGIPNVCFSLTDEDDNREELFIKQRRSRGFDDSETWSLRDTISNFIIPRLERYIEITEDKINTPTETEEKIKSFLIAMKLTSRENGCFILTEKETKEFEEGIENFADIFLGLWW